MTHDPAPAVDVSSAGFAGWRMAAVAWRQGERNRTFGQLSHAVWTGGKYGPGYHTAPHVFHPGFRGYHLFDSVKNWGFVDRFLDKVAYETEQYMKSVKFR